MADGMASHGTSSFLALGGPPPRAWGRMPFVPLGDFAALGGGWRKMLLWFPLGAAQGTHSHNTQ